MKEIRKRTRIVVLVAGLIAIGAMPALAQDKPADNMQIVLEKARADKKLFVATNMELNETEAKAFWPVYEKYQDELFLLRSRTAKLIKDYAKSFNDMTDQEAKVLLDEVMTIESLGLELRKAYLPQFRQVLPEKRVARYFQIENKIQAALYYELAKEIPLVQ
jgi:coproporphyrinogen III oxidase